MKLNKTHIAKSVWSPTVVPLEVLIIILLLKELMSIYMYWLDTTVSVKYVTNISLSYMW